MFNSGPLPLLGLQNAGLLNKTFYRGEAFPKGSDTPVSFGRALPSPGWETILHSCLSVLLR